MVYLCVYLYIYKYVCINLMLSFLSNFEWPSGFPFFTPPALLPYSHSLSLSLSLYGLWCCSLEDQPAYWVRACVCVYVEWERETMYHDNVISRWGRAGYYPRQDGNSLQIACTLFRLSRRKRITHTVYSSVLSIISLTLFATFYFVLCWWLRAQQWVDY